MATVVSEKLGALWAAGFWAYLSALSLAFLESTSFEWCLRKLFIVETGVEPGSKADKASQKSLFSGLGVGEILRKFGFVNLYFSAQRRIINFSPLD